jgi:hypothetical protein
VQKTYKRGRDALKAAIEKANTKKLHTFRKRAKELDYQLRILRPIAPAVFGELDDELKAIGRCLGQFHDLAFVAERLASIRPARKRGDRILNSLIDTREKELEETAIALGERFYAERPRQFSRRIARYFFQMEDDQNSLSPRLGLEVSRFRNYRKCSEIGSGRRRLTAKLRSVIIPSPPGLDAGAECLRLRRRKPRLRRCW